MTNPSLNFSIKDTLQWLWPYWRAMPIRLGFLLVMTPIVVAFDVYIPMVMKSIFDQLARAQLTPDFLAEKALFIFGLGMAHFLLYIGVQSTRGMTNYRFENDVRMRISEVMVGLGRKFFYRFQIGDVTTRLIDDVSEKKLGWFACSGIFRLYEALITILGCLYFMFQLNLALTLMTALPLGFVVMFYIWTSQKTTAYSRRTQSAISAVNSFLTNTIDGIRVVKAYNLEAAQTRDFEAAVQNQLQKEVALVKMASLLQLSYSRFSELGVLVIFLFGGWLVIHEVITLGALIAFNTYIFMLIWPMVDIGQFLIKGRTASVSVERVRELELFPPDLAVAEHPLPFPETAFDLRFEQVCFDFEHQRALTRIDMQIKPGQTVALAGAIGSGKSLLLDMIPRMIQPSEGQILLNDRALSLYSIEDLRQQIGFVSQIPSLFSDTLENNIRFGQPNLSETELNEAIRVSQLSQDLPLFKAGLQTRIGQRGMKVSGGQKQRIAIARALARKPKILILDDCTSALDAETEARLWQALYDYIPGLMVILVTHRVHTLQKADRIFLLRQGHLEAEGNHKELLSTSAYYRRLYLK